MILVFVSNVTPRLSYVFDFIFGVREIAYKLTVDEDEFSSFQGHKLNYSGQTLSGKQISPASICFDATIENHNVEWGGNNKWNCLSFNGEHDPIASIFFTLTRYEEYLLPSSELDEHGRFPYSKSILAENDAVEKANCDRWAHAILQFIDSEWVRIPKDVLMIPTFDIDNTFAYKLKKGKRMILSLIKDIFWGNKTRIKERSEVLNGAQDPYDTFDLISKIGIQFPQTLVFWLVGKRGKKDRNIPIEDKQHQAVIKAMEQHVEVNLHPSYASNSKSSLISAEKKALSEVIGRPIVRSRQHFLRFNVKNTFNALVSSGFTNEYSMGFAEHVGFRSGTSHAHNWFDLTANKQTDLMIHPFVYMDGTLNEYMNLSLDQSKKRITSLYKEVEEFGGDFIFLWHNETIGDYGKWKGWSEILDFTLKLKDE
ncbi:MAG: polysaccharide deacetylase family protein [Crocinitomicaceae bacterium]|nr:polysaccharide deacetylase family protein [Crocinitomicaceae bacterium]